MASDVSTPKSDAPEVDVNSIKHTLRMAILLCLACSVLVSVAAVGLRDQQERNKDNFRKENILKAAGLWDPEGDRAKQIEENFDQVTSVVLNLETGDASEDSDLAVEINKKIRKAIKDPTKSDVIADDIAGIKRREKETVVYTIAEDGKVKTLVLPIRGYGLWSTLWGFIALDVSDAASGPDQIIIKGLTYFEQKETPGLGGEVDNPKWKAKWVGKKAFDKDWNVRISVEKSAQGIYEVDGLSGATITSRGVSNMLKYWLGDEGFRPYLKSVSGVVVASAGSTGEHAAADDENKDGDLVEADHDEKKAHDSDTEHEKE